MRYPWSHLKFWESGEWQVVQERLHESRREGKVINPALIHMFTGLSLVPHNKVRVVILGQDPYPESKYATGVAFSIPALPKVYPYQTEKLPPSLVNIFEEYCSDLHYPKPISGDLTPWCTQGVLLWNAFPSCEAGKPGSHHWDEWTYLTREILQDVYNTNKHVIFIFLGGVAKSFAVYVPNAKTIMTSHPSPMGVKFGFKGSRIFTTCNDYLCKFGEEPINWRLP